jgi:hypothetical protein
MTCPGQAHLSCPLFCPCPVWEAHFEDLVQDKSWTCPECCQKRKSETKQLWESSQGFGYLKSDAKSTCQTCTQISEHEVIWGQPKSFWMVCSLLDLLWSSECTPPWPGLGLSRTRGPIPRMDTTVCIPPRQYLLCGSKEAVRWSLISLWMTKAIMRLMGTIQWTYLKQTSFDN